VHTITTVHGRPVESTTKTAKSRRRVSLDAATVAVLRAHRAAQRKERLLVGAGWMDHGLVFCRYDGSPLHPDHVTRRFRTLVGQTDLPSIRLHDLRHTYATLALQAGVHPKVVSERLGHATVGITLDLYSHVAPSLDQQAAETVAGLLRFGPPSPGPGHEF
jgi:integrase